MSTPEKKRGESSRTVPEVVEADTRAASVRQAGSETAENPDDSIPTRGRGGFRHVDLRTIPDTAIILKANPDKFKRVDIVTNYVPIEPMPNRIIQMYRVDFEPKVESASKMRYLFRTAAKGLFTKTPSYDGVHECRSVEKLAANETTSTIQDPQDQQTYTIKFVNTGTCTFGPEFSRIYNMHMKEFLRMLGFYSPQPGLFVHQNHCERIGEDIMMLRGFRTSANMHDGQKMLMNLEGGHKLVQKHNVLDIINVIVHRAGQGANLSSVINAALVGKVVVTSYNKRCYRIEEVDRSTHPTDTFDRNGTQTSYLDYYRTAHNKDIKDPRQPMLKVVPNNQRRREEESKVTLLVPELCNIAGLTDDQRSDFDLKKLLIKASQVSPANRVRHLREFLQTLNDNEDVKSQLQNWGYSYGTDLCSLKAHVIPMTKFAYGAICRQPPDAFSVANQNTASINVNGLARNPEIRKMVIVTPKRLLYQKPRLLKALENGFLAVGLKIPSSNVAFNDLRGDAPQDYIAAIRSLTPDTTLAIVIMPNKNKQCYDAIKKAASCEKGLITQVVTAGLLLKDERRARSVAQKIAIQVAAKVGGEPWWVDIDIKDMMVCGYDTYHDTTKRGRSYGAFVASLNMYYSRWWSKANAHERLEEVSSQISNNMIEALSNYKRFNGDKLPARIVLYRDGVGEGQLNHVFKVELETIRNALAKVAPHTKLTIIIVNKRIGARFYMRSGADGSFLNPTPGTVIDHTVTREGRLDFYLISQSTFNGTVTPTYYNIIHDDNAFNPDLHQSLAFKLCLLYYNWSGTVRVPAPCQYAHKLAFLCGEHLHSQPNATMDNKLHFL